MKFKYVFLSFIFVLSSFNIANTCGCVFISPFCNLSVSDQVYEVEIINEYHSGSSMDIKLLEHLYGADTVSYDTLTIAVAPHSCFVDNGIFEVGDILLIKFLELHSYSITNSNYPTVWFSECQIGYLFVEGDTLISYDLLTDNPLFPAAGGGIIWEIDTMDYQTFLDDIEGVCNISTPIEEIEIESKNNFSIFPNPTSQNFQIENGFSEKVNYQLFDASGRLVQEDDFFQQNNYEIDLSNFSKGIYFLKIQSGDYIGNEKIVKM